MIRGVYYRTVTTFLATGLTPHMTESMNHSASRQIPLSLSERQRLQRQWEEARAAMKAGAAHSPHAHRLLVECVVTDPASPLYVETLILNLQQWRGAAGASQRWTRWLRPAALQSAWREQRWSEILQRGPDLLALDPGDLRVLLPLIDACLQTDCRESAWRYLELATTLHPRQLEVRRRAGRLLLLLARFEEARGHWQAVVELAPKDPIARQFLACLPPLNAPPSNTPQMQLPSPQPLTKESHSSADFHSAVGERGGGEGTQLPSPQPLAKESRSSADFHSAVGERGKSSEPPCSNSTASKSRSLAKSRRSNHPSRSGSNWSSSSRAVLRESKSRSWQLAVAAFPPPSIYAINSPSVSVA
ncbi:MAG: hypothetical protein ACKOBW_17050 [Planctomycetota bacterium]